MSNRKTTKSKFTLPQVSNKISKGVVTLPYNGKLVSEKSFSFSFSCFDRTHKLFNLGDSTDTGTLPANWFIDLLDCLKSISGMTVPEMRRSMHDLHPIDWKHANTTKPDSQEQCEYWQFRINKSKGRVIGFLIDAVFYIVWLDPHHNLTNSEGYGTATVYGAGQSIYEKQKSEIEQLHDHIDELNEQIETYKDIFNNY